MNHEPLIPPADRTPAFDRFGPSIPDFPIILSAPHAGRDYAPEMLAQARVGVGVLRRLEDRFSDLLAHDVIGRGHSVLVARTPRAFIDLNRNEREIDPEMVAGLPRDAALQSSAKLRGGLGLVPRRLGDVPQLWRGPIAWTEVQRRIEVLHRPYHAEIARLMRAARDRFGHAILIDLHSMPPIAARAIGQAPVRLVLGDRFGRGASARLMTLAADIAAAHGVAAAQNHPYAGDHIIERHGRPGVGLHAIQLEVDRSLYLDAKLDQPGAGLAQMRAMVTDIVEALAVELPRREWQVAAE